MMCHFMIHGESGGGITYRPGRQSAWDCDKPPGTEGPPGCAHLQARALGGS